MTLDEADVSVGSFVVEAAIRVMEMEEVFVARIACGGQIWASLEKMSHFREGISGTASMTKSTVERSSMDVVGMRRLRTSSASDLEMRSFEISFASSFSVQSSVRFDMCCRVELALPANFSPLSIASWELSTIVTGTPALCAATNAIPKPLILLEIALDDG